MSYCGRPRLLSNCELGNARSMRATGASYYRIARYLGFSYSGARRVLTRGYKQPERRWK